MAARLLPSLGLFSYLFYSSLGSTNRTQTWGIGDGTDIEGKRLLVMAKLLASEGE